MAWECLDDPLVLSAFAGAGSAALSCARRLSRTKSSLSVRPLAGAFITSYFVGGALAVAGIHFFPEIPHLVLALVILAGWIWDWPSDDSRREWRSLAIERAKAMIQAALRDKEP